MGFFSKIKQFVGIGGVKLELIIDPTQPKVGQAGEINGKVKMLSKSDQTIEKLTFTLKETYTRGSGDSRTTQFFDLGKIEKSDVIKIGTGETKEVNFVLPFVLKKSATQDLADKGGALGALGKIGSFASNEKSTYKVHVDAKVTGTALGPGDSQKINFV